MKNALHKKRLKFESVVLPVLPRLYTCAFGLTMNRSGAQLLMETTYEEAIRRFENVHAEANIFNWMVRIMTQTFMTEYGDRMAEPIPKEVEASLIAQRGSISASGPSTSLEQPDDEALRDPVIVAFNQLEDGDRAAILLCDVCGMRYKEIAELLECSIASVRSCISRGRRTLNQLLEPQA